MYQRIRSQEQRRRPASHPGARPATRSAAVPIQYKLTVGRADDPAEREADAVAATVMSRLDDGSRGSVDTDESGPGVRRASASGAGTTDTVGGSEISGTAGLELGSSRGVGRAAPGSGEVLRRMEGAFGADFSGVRIHTGRDVDVAASGLRARAFTVGSDVYVRRSEYRPGTRTGDELLAHELTHTIQQDRSKVRRSTADPVEVRQRVGGHHVATKKEKMHLDFIRMKRMDPQFSKIIGKIVGVEVGGDEQSGGTYGHWWTEVGDLDPITNEFDYDTSYGWWPKDGVSGVKETFGGVEGTLNAGEDQDPHAGETAPIEFHPVMEVDTAKETYDQIRDRITQQIDTIATGYKGKWHWRFGWGKNCHTFQQHLKTKAGIHYQKSKKWLQDPAAQQLAMEKQAAAKKDQERRDANLAMAVEWATAPDSINFVDLTKMADVPVESGGEIAITGKKAKDFMKIDCVEVVTKRGDVGWIFASEWRNWSGR